MKKYLERKSFYRDCIHMVDFPSFANPFTSTPSPTLYPTPSFWSSLCPLWILLDHCSKSASQKIIKQQNCSVDPDETAHLEPSHQNLYCNSVCYFIYLFIYLFIFLQNCFGLQGWTGKKGENICDFLFAFLHTKTLLKRSHYENMPIQIHWKFYHHKMKIFR